jgi:hypothetical protein
MTYFILFILVALIIILKSPIIKGYIGEKSVEWQLNKLDKDKYIILNNITIPSASGKTTQIDHIVVSIFGVFVIETKNYRGWIMGDEKSEYWTQVIYKRKEKLYNPLRQNYGHVMSLKEVLKGYEELPIIPIVCFSTRADLKVTTTSEVIYTSQLVRTIRKYNEASIPMDNVKYITKTISSAEMVDKDVKKTHVQSIRNEIADRKMKVSSNQCPKCDGNLVLRKGKFGSFKGCSNFPSCRFILKNT